MKKILLVPALFFNLSTASADGFDWSSLANKVDVGGESTVMVSKIKFDNRSFAKQFCGHLGLQLAGYQTLLNVAVYGKPSVQETLFQARFPDGQVKYGVLGWDSQRPLGKYDDDPRKDTSVIFGYRGAGKQELSSLRTLRQQAEIMTYQEEPIEGLPAICE